MVAAVKTRSDGWAYFDELPAGRELVAIATTADGQQSPPRSFHVQPRGQTLVDALIVPRAATLTVKPALDHDFLQAFPKGRIELLILDRENPVARQEQRRERVGERDVVVFQGIQPGRWRTAALISTGTTVQPIPGEFVDVQPGTSKQI